MACGGGSSSNSNAGGPGGAGTPPGSFDVLKVTVLDSFGSGIPAAAVTGPRGTSSTDAQGVALLLFNPTQSTAPVNVTSPGYLEQTFDATVQPGQVTEVAVQLTRTRAPAGGSLTTRSGNPAVVSANAQQITFETELVVIGIDSQAIPSLSAANFVLRSCTADPAGQQPVCLRGSGDVGYTATAPTPQSLAVIGGQPGRPHAAALLLDQSGSIQQSDPTGARLFSAKAFLSELGAGDYALLAAFSGGQNALLPTVPMTVYSPVRDSSNATDYYPTLDSLRPLIGGDTPLYDSIDAVRAQLTADPLVPAGVAKAVVVFTDGSDTDCVDAADCRLRRAQTITSANAAQVSIFTIGLSQGIDVAAMGELTSQTGGVFLYAETAEQLLPLYGTVGKLLSLSLPTYRLRFTVQADAPGAFTSGSTLLGRVQVNAAGTSFDVPFVVGVP
jgi:hypothetical protein